MIRENCLGGRSAVFTLVNWIEFLAHLRIVGSRRSKACFLGQGLGRSFVTSLWLGSFLQLRLINALVVSGDLASLPSSCANSMPCRVRVKGCGVGSRWPDLVATPSHRRGCCWLDFHSSLPEETPTPPAQQEPWGLAGELSVPAVAASTDWPLPNQLCRHSSALLFLQLFCSSFPSVFSSS